MSSNVKYRPDIDGLRAVAITFVILFHFFPQVDLFKGGYIGVDIFFVISGYLITSIIKSSVDAGSFSYFSFYKARINRIFPSLLLVLLVSSVLAWFLLYSEELKHFGMYLISSCLFFGNILLNHEVGYFDASSYHKPFLHLWSLGIEEQCYFVWPLFFLLINKIKRPTYLVIGMLATSFLMQHYVAKTDINGAFYLPSFRFWELLSGAILAMVGASLIRLDATKKDYLSILGFLLLLIGIYLCGQSHSNLYILIFPILGASLLILSGPNSLLNQNVLSLNVMRYIGLISYPLYLWHWVVIYFDKILYTDNSLKHSLTLLTLSLLLSVLTYHFYENPIRRWKLNYKWIILLSALFLTTFVGYRFYKRDGYPHRQGIHQEAYEGAIGNDNFIRDVIATYPTCTPANISQSSDKYLGNPVCFQSKDSEVRNIAIVGDSHAGQLFPGFAKVLKKSNVVYYNSGILDGREDQLALIEVLTKDKNISTVIFSYYWHQVMPRIDAKQQTAFTSTLASIVSSGKQVVMLWDIPNFSFDASECKYFKVGGRAKCQEEDFYQDRKFRYQASLNNIIVSSKAQALQLDKYFCDPSLRICKMTHDHQILYRDDNHLNLLGSEFLASQLISESPETFRFDK